MWKQFIALAAIVLVGLCVSPQETKKTAEE